MEQIFDFVRSPFVQIKTAVVLLRRVRRLNLQTVY